MSRSVARIGTRWEVSENRVSEFERDVAWAQRGNTDCTAVWSRKLELVIASRAGLNRKRRQSARATFNNVNVQTFYRN